MRPEKRSTGTELVLHISEAEARELANGIVGLFRKRSDRAAFEWPNTAVATLDSHLTQYLNGLINGPQDHA